MPARSRMTQRAYVERASSAGVDDYGNPLPNSWAAHIAVLPCWLYGSTEREAVSEEATAVVANLKAMVPLSAEITELDRFGGSQPAIVDRRGEVIEPGVLGIETILRKRDHLQLTLSRVSS